MSDRDRRGHENSDSLGDWVRIYSNQREPQDWTPDNRNTTHPLRTPKHPYTTDFEDTVLETATELVALLIKKHKDYGPLNVANAPGGALNGLRVRIHDKVARVNHLLDKGVAPSNESLEDSFKDLANYAIIALLVLRGQWPSK